MSATASPATVVDERSGFHGGSGIVHVAALVLFFQSYSLVRAWVGGGPVSPFDHAREVMQLERALHVTPERKLQATILAHPSWCAAANVYYGGAHVVIPAVVLLVLYRYDRYRYRHAVLVLVVVNALAVVVFAVWPLMPPRLLPGVYGFADVGARFPGLPVDRALANGPGNGFAAMPSLHAAYALWSVWAVWPLLRRRRRALAVVYPLLTATVVMATGNHYWLDVVAGNLLVAVVVTVSGRHRPVGPTRLSALAPRRRVLCIVGLAMTTGYWLLQHEALNATVGGVLIFALAVTTDGRGPQARASRRAASTSVPPATFAPVAGGFEVPADAPV